MSDANPLFQFESKLERVNSDLYHFYFSVPDEVADKFKDGKDKRIVCDVNGKLTFQCALISIGHANYVILINKARIKKLGLVLGEVVNIRVKRDTSELGMSMSEEFVEVMNQHELGRALFEELTPGKKRTLIYWSDNVKSGDIKIRRALVMFRHLEMNQGQVDFKELNEQIKIENKRAKGLI